MASFPVLGQPVQYPLTPELQNAIRITWNISHWCNYQCDYCGVMVFSRRTGEKQQHSFDHYPVEDWLAAFLRLKQEKIIVKMLGGEPFVDRVNWKRMLSGLLEAGRFEIEVFTNGSWNADFFRDVPTPEKVHMVVSFHSGQTKFEPWRERLLRIRDAGFTIARAITVLAPENVEDAENFLAIMKSDGIQAALTPMTPAGIYMHKKQMAEQVSQLIEREVTPAIAWMQAQRFKTKGMPCFFPSVSYDLEFDGRIRVSCLDIPSTNFIREPLPEGPREAAVCPLDSCVGCMEMVYSMPINPFVEKPVRLFGELDFAEDIRAQWRHTGQNPNHFKETMSSAFMPDGKTDCYEAFTSLVKETVPPTIDIPVDGIYQAMPDVPVLGYIDGFQQAREARASERIMISGWAYNRSPLGPVKQVRMTMDGRSLGVFEDFYPRPELPQLFGRKELLEVGFQGLIFLPGLRPGNYELTAVAIDHNGQEHPLPPQPVNIIG